ncbi:hypothetical protein DYI23_00450 [Roseibium polysiphoniae]|uniref:Uncharacterized protein n=1 Tax=Roseibium polysiphoniae TaxID=2571221 RepID=A0A944C9Z5_9HYPH|nr:hypothetical protein [Roseibium polysiphoniae]
MGPAWFVAKQPPWNARGTGQQTAAVPGLSLVNCAKLVAQQDRLRGRRLNARLKLQPGRRSALLLP